MQADGGGGDKRENPLQRPGFVGWEKGEEGVRMERKLSSTDCWAIIPWTRPFLGAHFNPL